MYGLLNVDPHNLVTIGAISDSGVVEDFVCLATNIDFTNFRPFFDIKGEDHFLRYPE